MSTINAQFLQSNTDYKNCPSPDKPEFAFIGRSNVGKSSLINSITGNAKLAKVSAKPGKTKLINHFLVNKDWYLVDLPGYGFAKVSKEEKKSWEKMIQDYLINRQNLICVFVLIDSRLPPQKIDLEFIFWLGSQNIPFTIIFTKTDKQTLNKTNLNIKAFQQEMLKSWEEIPQIFQTSAVTGSGNKDLLTFIKKLSDDFSVS